MLATATATVKPSAGLVEAPRPAFVTLAYGWGYEDGAQGKHVGAWAYFTLTDPRFSEYMDGYAAGAQKGNRN